MLNKWHSFPFFAEHFFKSPLWPEIFLLTELGGNRKRDAVSENVKRGVTLKLEIIAGNFGFCDGSIQFLWSWGWIWFVVSCESRHREEIQILLLSLNQEYFLENFFLLRFFCEIFFGI